MYLDIWDNYLNQIEQLGFCLKEKPYGGSQVLKEETWFSSGANLLQAQNPYNKATEAIPNETENEYYHLRAYWCFEDSYQFPGIK